MQTHRRGFLLTTASLAGGAAFGTARDPLIDSHVHLFLANVPYAPNATYRPKTIDFGEYLAFVKKAGIDHVVVVHPEPYQDDHRALEYVFAHEPSPNYFKGTCLFDPIAQDTPARMEALARKYPGRIVAIRIHEMHKPGTPPLTSGAIRDRDLRDPAVKNVWKKARDLKIAVQMHFIPYYAGQIQEIATEFPEVPVILDHLARAGQGTPQDFEGVVRLAKLPHVYMKYSGVNYSSKLGFPFEDAKPLVRRAYEGFGPDRMIWGGLGMNMPEFRKNEETFAGMFDFAPEEARRKIRGATAKKLFGFS